MSRKLFLCNIPNCKESALYGVNDDKNKPYWCEIHMNEMKELNPEELFLFIKTNKKVCKDKLCEKRCSYNYINKKFSIFCKTHALKDMKNITVDKQCHGIINDKRCTKIPSYGLIGGTSLKDALYCASCYKKLPDKDKYEDVAHKKCLGVDDGKRCRKVPCYGNLGEPPSYCVVHAPEGMKNVANDYCSYTETISGEVKKCEIVATYGLIGTKKKLYCYQHSIIVGGCEDISHKKCIYKTDEKNCEFRAIYGFEEDGIRQYCKTHYLPGMTDLESNLCQQCTKRATYGFVEDNLRIRCNEHYEDGMIDLNRSRCTFIDPISNERCLIGANYNFFGKKEKIFCLHHYEEGMIDLSKPFCIHKNDKGEPCKEYAYYNIEGEKKKLFCYEHRLVNMIFRSNSITCKFKDGDKGCTTRPIFNYPGNKDGLYCKEHSLKDMIDVINTKCIHIFEDGKQCDKNPIFNEVDKKQRLYCGIHKKDNMVNIAKTLCVIEDCSEFAIYNYEHNKMPRYCCFHKTDDMVHKHERICKTFMCCTSITNSYSKDYCSRCFVHLFPDSVQSTNYRTKELEVVQFIKKHFDVEMDCNKKIKDGTSLRRPDIIIYIENYSIIIEIDEHRHSSYECECQNRRIMEISQDLKFQNTIFIRFNPDSYLNLESKRIPSCWSYDSKGKIYIANKEDWNQRLSVLKNTIEYWLQNPPEKMIETIQLFYDQNIDVD